MGADPKKLVMTVSSESISVQELTSTTTGTLSKVNVHICPTAAVAVAPLTVKLMVQLVEAEN